MSIDKSNNPSTGPETLDILERLLTGLNEDLQDLREDLLDGLENYDARLIQTTESLPPWQTLALADIREAYWFSHPDFDADTALGPRFVCSAAQVIEDYVNTWFYDDDEEILLPNFSDADILKSFEKDRQHLSVTLSHWIKDIAQLASSVQQQLDMLLDCAISKLEDQRETDIEVIELLVQQGELEPGRDARAEIAELWEEQRARANVLRRSWIALEELVHEGMKVARDGILELTQMYACVQEGLEGMFPMLEQTTNSDAHCLTLRLTPADPAETNEEIISETPDIVEKAETPQHPTDSLSLHVDNQDNEVAALAQSTMVADQPSHPDDFGPDMPTMKLSSFDETSSVFPAPTIALPTTDVPISDKVAAKQQTEQNNLTIESTGFRILTRWSRVKNTTVLALMAVPGLIITTMLVLSCMFLFDLVDNPLHVWPWSPYLVAFGLLWLIAAPLIAGWHINWRGAKPTIIVLNSVEEEISLGVRKNLFHLGDNAWKISEVRFPTHFRWESVDDELWGWLMSTKLPNKETMTLTTWEESRQLWEESPLPRVDVPELAWQIEPSEFVQIKNALDHYKK